jgi:hypothetical protein
MALSEPRIVCAACRDATGQIVAAPRHFDQTMHAQIKAMMNYTAPWEQGFIDQHGKFYDRQQAYVIAQNNGQIVRVIDHAIGTLYSENLY